MASKIDPAILQALSLDAAATTIASHGGSGFASTFKITSKGSDGGEKLFFIKQGKGRESEIMFAGEHTSLNAIHSIIPSLCPRSYAHGPLTSTNNSFFLATDFLNLSPNTSTSTTSSGLSLAQKLAKLHSTPAPIPAGYDRPMFGFSVPTCCGDTRQDNSFKSSWAEFYAENRLRGVLREGEKKHGRDSELGSLVQRTVSLVVPRLLRDGYLRTTEGGNVLPVVVHGDLWSGNHGRGTIGEGSVEEVVFDPSSSYSHAEFEWGIMRMFGGFSGAFGEEYFGLKGKDEPIEEWEDRVMLYELYHHLNHYSIFGGGYRGSAVRIMENLLRKFADER